MTDDQKELTEAKVLDADGQVTVPTIAPEIGPDGLVDDATALARQKAAALQAIDYAHEHNMSLGVIVFCANDGESMSVFGIEGVDVELILQLASSHGWVADEDQPFVGN